MSDKVFTIFLYYSYHLSANMQGKMSLSNPGLLICSVSTRDLKTDNRENIHIISSVVKLLREDGRCGKNCSVEERIANQCDHCRCAGYIQVVEHKDSNVPLSTIASFKQLALKDYSNKPSSSPPTTLSPKTTFILPLHNLPIFRGGA